MKKPLFLRLVEACEHENLYFQQKRDRAGRLGFTPLVKVTVALRMLAYSNPADSLDEPYHIGESTACATLRQFCKTILWLYKTTYLRQPNGDDIKRLLERAERRGFLGMIGSIDCMHYFCPKISDFGLAKLCQNKQSILSLLGTRGTIGYIAPEVFSRNFRAVSHKSNVYSYGMTILDMLGARKISEVEAVKSSESYFPDKVYEQGILNKIKELNEMILSDEEEETESKMFLIGFWCIQTNPSDRPLMSKVVEMFEGSLESICIPPKPILSSPTLQQFSSTLPVDLETETSLQGYLS
ncbi:hypothetical protein RD792_016933 [Penstemon davidsonii]|uniref:Protein kinase domain-containing protein n=1 Tax=Penstemon davidsonii TaxID=160366 RepID=A0ABR0CMF2_9LAMI|nr:hypothetical protein RD792_016933 [Penstemon davidsonii]